MPFPLPLLCVYRAFVVCARLGIWFMPGGSGGRRRESGAIFFFFYSRCVDWCGCNTNSCLASQNKKKKTIEREGPCLRILEKRADVFSFVELSRQTRKPNGKQWTDKARTSFFFFMIITFLLSQCGCAFARTALFFFFFIQCITYLFCSFSDRCSSRSPFLLLSVIFASTKKEEKKKKKKQGFSENSIHFTCSFFLF